MGIPINCPSCGNLFMVKPSHLNRRKTCSISCSRKQKTKEITWKNENGCWICTSHCLSDHGYPIITENGKHYPMSRFIYKKHFGEIPPKILVCHRCDNPSCINPEHLFLGTQADNMRDMKIKGRSHHPIGEKNPRALIKESDVLAIRELNLSQRKTAERFGIKKTTVYAIRKGLSWKHI